MSEAAVAPPSAKDTSVLGAGLLGAAAAGALVAAAAGGRPVLAAVLFPCQVLLAVAWLGVLRARGRLGAAVVGVGAAAAADALVATGPVGARRLAGVLGVALLVALVHQLTRRDGRAELTTSLAATLGAVAFVTAAATLIALRGGEAGTTAVQAALGAVAAALLVSRLADAALPRGPLIDGSSHSWVGLVAGLVAAVGVGLLVGGTRPELGAGNGAVLALAAGVVALATELGIALARAAGPVDPGTRAGPAPWLPLAALLPLATAAPVAYVTGRILLG